MRVVRTGTSGQIYHHIRTLTAAGWLRSSGRGQVQVPADPVTGRTVVWHNGGTGGFTSFLGVDREAGVAVAVLSAVGAPDETTPAGFALLRRLGGAR